MNEPSSSLYNFTHRFSLPLHGWSSALCFRVCSLFYTRHWMGRAVSFTAWQFLPRQRLNKRLSGPQSGSRCCRAEKNLLLLLEIRRRLLGRQTYNTARISTKLIRFLTYMQTFVISYNSINDIIKALNLHAIKEVIKLNSWKRRHIIRFLNWYCKIMQMK